MKLKILSDVHFEHSKNAVELSRLVSDNPGGEVDTLILAGDIDSPFEIVRTLKTLSDHFPNIIYVAGNHDYYGIQPASFLEKMSKLPANVHWLNNSLVNIDGQKFYGGTMWFPRSPISEAFIPRMQCFREILLPPPKQVHDWACTEHKKFISGYKKNVDNNTIVISHFVPFSLSVDKRYINSNANWYFNCNMDSMTLDPSFPMGRLWIHGHTHAIHDYTIGPTRVVCNPLGYPGELKDAILNKIVEI